MRILLLGGNGQVGYHLRRTLPIIGQIHAPARDALDVTDFKAVKRELVAWQPQLIVNAAAYTQVDQAEEDTGAAWRLNAELPDMLAKEAAERDALLVHYSTDYVYSGRGDAPWHESSPCDPVNEYGKSKLAGDAAITQRRAPHLIFRTSWVYSARRHNFMNTLLRLGREREQLTLVYDQRGAPTPARLIAQVTAMSLLKRRTGQSDGMPDGVYHLAPNGSTTWCGLGKEIVHRASAIGLPMQVCPKRILPIPSRDYPTRAQRPLNSQLHLGKLERALGLRLPHWRDELDLTLQEAQLGA